MATIPKKYLTKTYLETYAQNQIEKYLSVGKVDEKLAEQHIGNAYKVAGLAEPKNIIWYDSPKIFADSVWESVKASVWESVWESVWASVRASVRASVGDSVWESVKASVWESVWESVKASVGDSVWASVGESVRASVGDSVWASVGDSVWASVGESVRASVGDSVWAYYNSGYDSWLKFFNDHQEENDFRHICMFDEMVTGYLLTADTVHIVRKPIFLSRNNDGRLDNDQRKAIEWADGYGFYYLQGVEFPQDIWQKIVDQKFTMEDLAKGNLNAQQRPVAIQMLRPDLLLKQVNAKLINVGVKGTKLYQVDNFMDTGETEYCMLMTHPTIPSKQYIEWVEPNVGKKKDADLAQATAFGIPKEDYLMAIEA